MVNSSPESPGNVPYRHALVRLSLFGLALGLLHIVPAFGLTGGLTGAVRVVGSVWLIAAIYRTWRDLGAFWTALSAGLATGLCYFGVALYWLGSSANPDPDTFTRDEIVLGLGALCLFFPWWGAWFGAARLLTRLGRERPGIRPLAFITAFAGANILLGDFAYGIPMAPLSLAAVDTPVIQLLPLVGQFGLDTIIVATGTLVAVLVDSPRYRAPMTALGLPAAAVGVCAALAALGPPHSRETPIAPDGARRVYLAQPSLPHVSLMPPDDVERTVHTELFRQIDIGVQQGAGLIVLPELSFMEDLTASTEIVASISQRLSGDQQVLAGFPRVEVTSKGGSQTVRPYNSAMLIGATGRIAVFTKAHLVPFGETMPQLFFDLGFNVVAGPAGGYGRADSISVAHALPDGIPPFSPVICYEAMLSGPVSRETEGAEWLLNLSAEGLFRGTIGPRLLLEYVRLRAIETGLPVLRSTAHAFSGVILPDGSVDQVLSEEERGGVLTTIPAARPTLFRAAGYDPLYGVLALALATILAAGTLGPSTHRLRQTGKFPTID